jgi:Amt family ammonium transporter
MKKFWSAAFGILFTVSLLGAFWPNTAQVVTGGPASPADIAWMLTATGLVLLMTPGLSYFYGGMVSSKNVISTMLQSFIAMGVISILWVVFGFSLAFGDSIGGIIGNPFTYFMFNGVGSETHPALSPTIPLILFAMFQLKFAIYSCFNNRFFCERVKFSSYLLFIVLFSILFMHH